MQIEAQVPRALVPRRSGALLRRLAQLQVRGQRERDGRVSVGWVGVGEGQGAGGEVAGVGGCVV